MTLEQANAQRAAAVEMAKKQAERRAAEAAQVRASVVLSDSAVPYDAKTEMPMFKAQRTGGDFCGSN